MAAFGDDQVGRVLGGRYRLIAPVGTGASATVFMADDVQLQRRVAVKILHPSLAEDAAFLKRFRAEAQAAAALSHPNVMAVYDWGHDGESSTSTPYLVLEYLAGGSLRSMLDRGRQLSPSQALLVGLEAARGLDYAHRRGFVHRDIKPANLLFGQDRRLRIADFGLARAIAEAAWTEPDGVVLGTARYASPEQAPGTAAADDTTLVGAAGGGRPDDATPGNGRARPSSAPAATAEIPRPAVPVVVGGVAVDERARPAPAPPGGTPPTPTIYDAERD